MASQPGTARAGGGSKDGPNVCNVQVILRCRSGGEGVVWWGMVQQLLLGAHTCVCKCPTPLGLASPCRPPSKEEIAQRTPQVVACSEPTREVTLSQNVGGKTIGRTYHFDRVRLGAL